MIHTFLGDTAVALLKAGAETDKKDVDGHLAMELAPDAQVPPLSHPYNTVLTFVASGQKVHSPISGAGRHRFIALITQ